MRTTKSLVVLLHSMGKELTRAQNCVMCATDTITPSIRSNARHFSHFHCRRFTVTVKESYSGHVGQMNIPECQSSSSYWTQT